MTDLKQKALWLLKTGRVKVDVLYLLVRGTEEYSVSYKDGKYICVCPWNTLRKSDCSHIVAAKMLVEGWLNGEAPTAGKEDIKAPSS